MFGRKVLFILYSIIFPLSIGVVLVLIPEFAVSNKINNIFLFLRMLIAFVIALVVCQR